MSSKKEKMVTNRTPKTSLKIRSTSKVPSAKTKHRRNIAITKKETKDINMICEFITQNHVDISNKIYRDSIQKARIEAMSSGDPLDIEMFEIFQTSKHLAVCLMVEAMKLYGKGNFEFYMENENPGDWNTGRNMNHYVKVWNIVFPSKNRPRNRSYDFADV
jgi:hypothetical protein